MELRIWLLKMKARCELTVLHPQHDLHQTCEASCRIDMADVRFNGTQSAVARSQRAFAKRLCQSFHFDRIAERRGRSVSFDVRNRIGIYARYFQRFGNDRSLAFDTRSRVTNF